MQPLTLEYIAGFVDGEGSFMILKGSADYYHPVFQITNTNPQILKDIQKFFSCTSKVRPERPGKPNWKTIYRLTAFDIDSCKSIATQLEPYLRIKKEHAQIIMQYPRADPTLRGPRSFGDLSTKGLQLKLRKRILALNIRGLNNHESNEDLQPEPDPQLNLLDLNRKEVS